ncbi:MAG: glycerophosphodiester phosphodiesterase family protein [Pseudomonadales bacterium]
MIADKLIAHRGWQRRYPENTLLGIEKALGVGARHIEIDIQLSADHIPVLCHDHILLRVCGREHNINHCKFDTLQSFSAYEPERLGDAFTGTPLSPLSDCVKLFMAHPETTLYVELKRQSIRTFGATAVLNSVLPLLKNIVDHCFLISFDIDVLQQALNRGWKTVAPVISDLEQLQQPPIQQLSPSLIFCHVSLLGNDYNFSDLIFPSAIYEIDSYQQANLLIKRGATMVETFAIGEIITEESKDNNH